MEHRQNVWGGLTLVSASLAMILTAILFLGNGVAWGQTDVNSTGGGDLYMNSTHYNNGSAIANLPGAPGGLEQGRIHADDGDILANSTVLINVSNITSTLGDISLINGSSITINSSGTAVGNGTISAGGSILIDKSTLNVSESTNGNVTITAVDSIILNNGTINEAAGFIDYINSTDGSVTIDNYSSINISGNISGNISVEILNHSKVNVSDIVVTEGYLNISNGSVVVATGNIKANTSIYINSSNVTVDGDLNATHGEIQIIDAGNITTANISANTSINISGGTGNITTGNISTTVGNISFSDTYNLTVRGNITANNSVIIERGNVTITGDLNTTSGEIKIINADTVTTANISANTSINISGGTGNITTGNLSTTVGNISFSDTYNLTVRGNITANNSVIIERGNVSVAGDLNATDGLVNITGAESVKAANIYANTSISIKDSTVNLTGTNAIINASKGALTIDGATVFNGSGTLTLFTGFNQRLTITGNAKVNATEVFTENGTLTIEGGLNYLSDIIAKASNVSITGGENIIGDLTVTDDSTRSFGSVKISDGLNTIDNISLTNTSLEVSGTSENTFKTNITIFNGSLSFVGGTSVLGTASGTIDINVTDFRTGATNNNTIVSGTNTVLALAPGSTVNFTSANDGIILKDGARLHSRGSIANRIASGYIDVLEDSVLDVGNSTLTVDRGVYFESGSTLAISGTSTVTGQLIANVVANPDVFLDLTGKPDRTDWDGEILINATVTNTTAIEDTFVTPWFDVSLDSNNNLVVDHYVGATKAIKNVADAGDFGYTRNMASAASLIQEILDDGFSSSDPDFNQAAQDIQDLISDLYLYARAGEGDAVELLIRQSIGEATLGVKNAVVNTVFKANSVVLGRLDKIHTADLKTPPAAGEGLLNRAWIGGFGSWAKQDDADEVAGYDYHAGGFALGYDRTFDGVPGLVLGISTAFSFGEVEPNHYNSKIDTDTVSVGVYGSYKFDSGLFIDGTFAYAHSENDARTQTVLGAKSGSYDIDTWQFGIRGGWIFQAGSFEITPSIGIRYLHLKQDEWSEHATGAALIRNYFRGYNDHLVDIPVQVKINTTIDTGGVKITPELRLGVTFAAKELDNKVDMGFVGYRGTTPIWGIKQERTSFQVGTGLKVKVNDSVDIFANYDLDVSKNFYNHQASIGIGFEF